MFLASFGEDLVGIIILGSQFLSLVLHSKGDRVTVAFDIVDEIAQNTIDRLTNDSLM